MVALGGRLVLCGARWGPGREQASEGQSPAGPVTAAAPGLPRRPWACFPENVPESRGEGAVAGRWAFGGRRMGREERKGRAAGRSSPRRPPPAGAGPVSCVPGEKGAVGRTASLRDSHVGSCTPGAQNAALFRSKAIAGAASRDEVTLERGGPASNTAASLRKGGSRTHRETPRGGEDRHRGDVPTVP